MLFADSLGSEGHDDVFPLSLAMLALALQSYVHVLERTGARLGSHLNISCSRCFAALPTRDLVAHGGSPPASTTTQHPCASLEPGVGACRCLWSDFGSSFAPIIKPDEMGA
jgi:hypothetical protein